MALTILAVLAGSQADAQTPSAPLTLEAAIQQALAANPFIAAARLRRPVDLAGVDVARERPNPELFFDVERETPHQAITGVLPLELGGKRQRRVDLALAVVAAGDADFGHLMAEARSAVRRAYFGLAVARDRVALFEDIRALAVRARDVAQTRFATGDAPRLEALQTEMALAATDNDVTAARGDAAVAAAELTALLGLPPGTPLTLAADLSSGALPALGRALSDAEEANTELAALGRRIEAQVARRDLARALQVPDLAAGSSFTYHAQPEFSYGWRFSLSLAVPIFTRHSAGVEVETAELARLQAERAALSAGIAGTVTAALARAEAASQQVTRYLADILPRALEVEQMAQEGYAAGQTGLVSLLQALQSAREVRRRGLQAALDYQLALADLERAIGAPIR